MKIAALKIFVASTVLFATSSAQALQPEVLYAFQRGPFEMATSVGMYLYREGNEVQALRSISSL